VSGIWIGVRRIDNRGESSRGQARAGGKGNLPKGVLHSLRTTMRKVASKLLPRRKTVSICAVLDCQGGRESDRGKKKKNTSLIGLAERSGFTPAGQMSLKRGKKKETGGGKV